MNFLDTKIKNSNGRYEFDIYFKPALTNAQIKSHSCIPSGTITSLFRGFLARTTKICSEKYLRVGTEYLTDMFAKMDTKNINKKLLQKIINNFEKKTRTISDNNNTDKKQTITFPSIPKIKPKIKKEI